MIEIKQFQLGPLETNCYLLYTDTEAVVVDPGGDPEEVLAFLKARGLTLTHILNTHLHFDHIQGNARLARETGAPILASDKDAYLLDTDLGGGGFMGFPRTDSFSFEPVSEGEITLLGEACQVLETPGHSPGCVAYYFPSMKAVFSGDLLFYRSVGRTDFPGGSEELLKRSVVAKIFTLHDQTMVYPGHGPETMVGDEKINNPFFSEFGRL